VTDWQVLQNSETFDTSHAFLTLTVAKLSTFKQMRFLAHPVQHCWRMCCICCCMFAAFRNSWTSQARFLSRRRKKASGRLLGKKVLHPSSL